jgi:hypothetical protein
MDKMYVYYINEHIQGFFIFNNVYQNNIYKFYIDSKMDRI